jgi:hypothetical protein
VTSMAVRVFGVGLPSIFSSFSVGTVLLAFDYAGGCFYSGWVQGTATSGVETTAGGVAIGNDLPDTTSNKATDAILGQLVGTTVGLNISALLAYGAGQIVLSIYDPPGANVIYKATRTPNLSGVCTGVTILTNGFSSVDLKDPDKQNLYNDMFNPTLSGAPPLASD